MPILLEFLQEIEEERTLPTSLSRPGNPDTKLTQTLPRPKMNDQYHVT